MAVTGIEIRNRAPYEQGRVFGKGGAYERIDALVSFAVDPAAELNSGIADLDLASRDSSGCVTFTADLTLLQPVQPANASGDLLCSVVNRGRTALLPFSYPPPGMDMTFSDRIEPGDGFLLDAGWTVALCAWQWDVVRRPGALGLEAPLAYGPDGRPASVNVRVQFQPLTARRSEYLGHWPTHPNPHPDRVHHAYPAADLADPAATLTVRASQAAPAVALPQNTWRFGRVDDAGRETPDATSVTLNGAFEAGRIYELTYRTEHCPVAGAGLLAIRDAASFLRFGPADTNPCAGRVTHAFAHGVSQTGRFLREFIRCGLNVDEARRQVFDGIFVQIAGARRGEFNFRGAQPSVQYVSGPAFEPPYTYAPTAYCPETLLDRQRERGGVPRIFEVNTANEYWRSDGALLHHDPIAGAPLDLPVDVRVYMMAGCQHGPGLPFLTDRQVLMPEQRATHALSMLNYAPLTRAALLNLQRWAVAGVEPPASSVPTPADGSAETRERIIQRFKELPGVTTPDPALLTSPCDTGDEDTYPVFVAAVDGDCNETAGIRLPEVQVPLATYAGWNVRHPENGGEGQLADMIGSTIPFAVDEGERQRTGDPRPSIAARYRDRQHYAALVRAAAERLASERWLLPQDIDRLVTAASKTYDRLTAPRVG